VQSQLSARFKNCRSGRTADPGQDGHRSPAQIHSTRADTRLIRGTPFKPVAAPLNAADRVMDKEEAVRVVLALDGQQPLVVRTPIGPLPIFLEEIALGDVGGGLRRDPTQLAHGVGDRRRLGARLIEVGFIAGNPGIGWGPIAPNQRQALLCNHYLFSHFIQPDAGGADVFVHISAVERAGLQNLNEGQKIAYEVVADRRTGKSSADNLKPV
jgi:cold shock protein